MSLFKHGNEPDPCEDPIETFTYEELDEFIMTEMRDRPRYSSPDPSYHEWVFRLMKPGDTIEICYTSHNLNGTGWV